MPQRPPHWIDRPEEVRKLVDLLVPRSSMALRTCDVVMRNSPSLPVALARGWHRGLTNNGHFCYLNAGIVMLSTIPDLDLHTVEEPRCVTTKSAHACTPCTLRSLLHLILRSARDCRVVLTSSPIRCDLPLGGSCCNNGIQPSLSRALPRVTWERA